jgi:Mg-chelatase subunit ChlD
MRTVFAVLDESDEISLVVFADGVMVPVNWTSPPSLPGLDWAQWVLPDNTALVDGVHTALRLMDSARRIQPVVLVLSDGEELSSGTPLGRLVTTRAQSEAEVHAFRTDPPSDVRGWFPRDVAEHDGPAGTFDYLSTLVGDSGGVVYSLRNSESVVGATRALVADLRNRYTVSYAAAKPPDGKYRRIRVEVTDRDVRVRHRGGYLALPPEASPRP